MKNIIVPTDFSDGAFNALIHAVEMAKITGASIRVIHAYSMPSTGSAVMVDIVDILKKNADEELGNLAVRTKQLKSAEGVTITYHSLHGAVVDVINRECEDENIDLVVMGTQGASGITEKWLGSNTAAAARNVNVPLIAIPAELPFKKYDKMLFATDMKVLENMHPLKFVAELADHCNSKVKFMHIRKHGEESDDKKVEEFQKQVGSVFGERNPSFAFLFDDEIEDGLADAIESERPDLVVVIRHEYGFFKGLFHSSTSQRLVNNASLPILVMKG
ncbi:MAG TPA: universal stress protein [Cryomorphaceae bacterium]|nr:universal stress protein [Cryomorphaceae bacterium]